MKKLTNINIISPYGSMPFYFEYNPSNLRKKDYYFKVGYDDYLDGERNKYISSITFKNNQDGIVRNGNEWRDDPFGQYTVISTPHINEDADTELRSMTNVRTSELRVYIPKFSPIVYLDGVQYVLDASIRICGVDIILGNFLLKPIDALALDKIVTINNMEYFEYLAVDIPDPWEIIYSEDMRSFRENYCNTSISPLKTEMNNLSSFVNLSFHVCSVEDQTEIEVGGDKASINIYREDYYFRGGQNSLNFAISEDDYLKFRIEPSLTETRYDDNGEEKPLGFSIKTSLIFNAAYEQNERGFVEYLYETYGIEEFEMQMILSIQDQEDVYAFAQNSIGTYNINEVLSGNVDFHNGGPSPWSIIELSEIISTHGQPLFTFDAWTNYFEGMYIQAILSLKLPDNEPIFIKSNPIALTQETFRYIVKTHNDVHKYIDLNKLNEMPTFNINAVNKIVQNVTKIDRPEDYKSNVIQPVFFRSQPLGTINLHRGVREYLCLNLDKYKTKVKSFILKISGMNFSEYARTQSGIVFKINADDSANISSNTGIYSILNENGDFVTDGQYNVN